MPDLQSELSKLANVWDTHEQTIRTDTHTPPKEKTVKPFIKTGNASRDLFAMIRDNPHFYTGHAAFTMLVDAGYKKTSASALVTQMKRCEYFKTDDNDRLYTTMQEYKPLPHNKKTPKPKKAKPVKQAKPASAGIAALQVAEEPARKQLVLKMTAEDVLTKLDVKEAFALYQELAKMFGGK